MIELQSENFGTVRVILRSNEAIHSCIIGYSWRIILGGCSSIMNKRLMLQLSG